jgi:secondary thiamine-phosphate synthase enzyme
MRIHNKTLRVRSGRGVNLINITPQLKELVRESGVSNGFLAVFVRHTTVGVRINEDEERLLEDIHLFFEKIAPKNAKYLHDDIHLRDCPPDERLNGHSHIKSLMLNTTEQIPVAENKLALGKWQNVFFIELDGAREREVIVQIIGD